MSRASEADEHSERAKMYQNCVLEGNELYPPLHSMFVGYYDYSIPGPPDVEWPNEDLKPDEFQCINEGFNLRKHILDLFEESLNSALGDKCVAVNRPSIAPIEGDYQCYHLLSNLADLPGKVHADSVGEAISKSLTNCQIVQSFCAEGLGVSILLSDTWMEKSITNLVRGGIKQWAPKLLIKKAVMDFSSPDSPGAMDFLHFIAAITGDSITRILQFSDVTVMRAFHVTAYGSQGWQLIRPSEWMPMPPDSCQELLEIYTRAGVCWQEEDGTFYSIKEEALNHLTNVMKDKFLVMPSGIVKTELISLQYRVKYQKAEWIIYVSAHEDHFLQTLKVAESVRWLGSDNGYPKGSYISLPKKREAMPFNGVLKEVSRRSNNLIKFVLSSQDQNVRVQISDAVAYASLKYAILKSPSDEIDVNHLFNRKGKTAVYLLRTYSWISGMLKEDIHIEELKKNNAILIADFGAPVLIQCRCSSSSIHLLRFPEVIQEAVDSLSASVLCEYLYHLAMIFTEKFYEEYARELKFATLCYREPLLQKMLSDISSRRTLLIAGCKIVMEKCLQLLGLEPVSTLLF